MEKEHTSSRLKTRQCSYPQWELQIGWFWVFYFLQRCETWQISIGYMLLYASLKAHRTRLWCKSQKWCFFIGSYFFQDDHRTSSLCSLVIR